MSFSDSNPGFVTGQRPTATQWNSYFAEKVDVTNGDLTDPTFHGTLAGTPAISGAWNFTGTPTFANGAIFSSGATFASGVFGIAPNNILTLTPGAASSNPFVFSQSGTGGFQFGSGSNNIATLSPGAASSTAISFAQSGSGGWSFGGNVAGGRFTVSGSPITLSGTTINNRNYLASANVSGSTSRTDDTTLGQVELVTSSFTADVTGATWNQLLLNLNGGNGWAGNIIQIHPTFTTQNSAAFTGAGHGVVLIGGKVSVQHNMGGTPTNPRGAFFGINPRLEATAGASDIYALSNEFGLINNCTSVDHISVVNVVLEAGFNQHALHNEAAYVLSAQTGAAVGLFTGWQVGSQGAQWPIDANGTIFRATRGSNDGTVSAAAAAGIDFNQVTFSGTGDLGGGFAWRSPGFQILDNAAAQIGYGKIDGSSGGLVITSPYQVLDGTPTVSDGGTDWVTGGLAGDAYGNVVRVNASAGVVTSVASVIKRGYVESPPSNPVPFTFISQSSGRGTGLELDLLWVASNNVTVQASGGSLGFFGATPVAKPTGVAVSAAGIHAALVDLGLIAA